MNPTKNNIQEAIKFGLLAGVISLSVSVIGMVELFSDRDLIAGVLSLGQVFLFAAPVAFGYLIAQKSPEGKPGTTMVNGFLTGICVALPLIILIILESLFDLR